mmetsp:Transcript_25120/g.52148  ORF Transcript_25120/g.52148 Transcript_25120/m.52148 type:complete len:518 (+) Transcript_25120:79-1632(+)
MPKESIHLHIGQAGCQVGCSCWELYCQEHKIDVNGRRAEGDENDTTFESFFQETPHGSYVPRAVFLDPDPSTRNNILHKLPHGRLFHPENIIAYKQDCHNNFFEGRSMASIFKISEDVLDRIRREADQCSNFQGFMVVQSFGGGTGSGMGVEVLTQLRDHFDRKPIIQPLIYPSNHFANSIVEPYNCVLATHYLRDIVDLSLMMDNQAAYSMIKKGLRRENPDFQDINRLLAQCLSATTTSLRYDTILNATFSEIITNLVPMTGYRYPILSLAPVSHDDGGALHEHNTTQNILTDLFEDGHLLADCGGILKRNRYLAAVILLRGVERHQQDDKDTSNTLKSHPGLAATLGTMGTHHNMEPEEFLAPIQANAAAKYLQQMLNPPTTHRRPIRFAPWMGTLGFKVGVVGVPPCIPKGFMSFTRRQGSCIGNTTAVRQLFVRQYIKFCKLFFHKAYVWQFIDANGEMDSFYESREGMLDIINQYEQMLRQCCQDENADAGEDVSGLCGETKLPEMVAGTE